MKSGAAASTDRELLERAWAVLVETARARKTIAYSELALALKMPSKQRSIHRIAVSPICSLVCLPNNYPDMASLVVRKDTGEPGDGWWAPFGGKQLPQQWQLWRDELQAVHDFDWPDKLPLSGG